MSKIHRITLHDGNTEKLRSVHPVSDEREWQCGCELKNDALPAHGVKLRKNL